MLSPGELLDGPVECRRVGFPRAGRQEGEVSGAPVRAREEPPQPDAAGLGGPHAVEVRGLAARNDGNNVSIDREARLLAENALRFNIATNLLRGQIRTVRESIQEGKSG